MTVAILVAALALARMRADGPITIHVSPTGVDTIVGGGHELPLATPMGARNRIRALRAQHSGSLPGPVTVLIQPGCYRLDEPLVLTPEDSGVLDIPPVGIRHGRNEYQLLPEELDRPEAPIVYAPASGGEVVFSGGAPLGVWRETTIDGKPVWAAALPDLSGSPPELRTVRNLWVNGERRPRAHHPNRGYLRVRDVPEAPAGSQWMDGTKWFRFKDEDAALWGRIDPGAEVVTFTRWVDTHLTVESLDRNARIARFTTRNMFLLNPDDLYMVENDRDLLDDAGEWWIDEPARVLYYLPMPWETPDTAEGIVPRLATLVQLCGEPGQGRFVEYVTFKGITFAHAGWWFPPGFKASWPHPDAVGFPQAAAGVPGAVLADGAKRVTFDGCTITHVGGYGLELARGCTMNTLRQCTLTDLGAGGIKIGEPVIREAILERSVANVVEDCVISDGGHTHHQAVGLWIGQSGMNIIRHNLIERFDYTGISVGWTWGYGPSLAGGNQIQYNEVRDLGAHSRNAEPPLGDMAGIYTLGTQKNTLIRYNYFHDIAGRSIAWGIYFDEGSTEIVAEGNVVLRTTHGGFHQHYGRDNVVRNNVFAFGRDAQLWRTRREEHNSFTFERNIVVGDNDRWFAGDWSSGFVLRANMYWRTDGGVIPFPAGGNLAGWQAAGHDVNSVIADPCFADLAAGDVAVPPDSMAAGRGFDQVGRVRPGPRR